MNPHVMALRRPRRLTVIALSLVTAVAVQARSACADIIKSFDVKCDDKNLGKITIDVYKNVSNADFWSVDIKGGFDTTGDSCKLADGYNYRWLQAFKLNQSFLPWQKADTWYMDRTRKPAPDDKIVADSSPFYVNLRGSGYGHDPLGYQDTPRLFTTRTKPIDWVFETALVCAQTPPDKSDPAKVRNIFLVDSFTWGFDVDTDGKLTLKPITETMKVSDDLIGAFKTDPDMDTFSKSWTLQRGCCCAMPEPPSLVLVAVGGFPLLLVAVWRRRSAGLARARL